MDTEPFIVFATGEVEAVRKEVVILRQELSDRDETISDLKQQLKQHGASEATIKMLKEKGHSKLLTAARKVKKEAATKAVQLSHQQTEPGR